MRRGWLVKAISPLRPAARWASSRTLILGCSLALAVASAVQANVEVSPSSLDFEATQGATNPDPKSISVRSRVPSFEWKATTDALWLEVDPREGTSPGQATVSVNLRNLTAEVHRATITIAPAQGQGAPMTIPVSFTVKHHPVLRTYSVIELGKQHGSLTGILAGFALTVAILLIERSEGTRVPELFARSSIVSFFVAFAASLETAFNFVVIGAETENSVRLAVQLIPVVFGLSICILYLFMGIALALFEYRIAEHMPTFVILLSFVALAFLGLNMAFSTLWSIAVWEEKIIGALTTHSPLFSYGLIFLAAIPAVIVAIRILTARKEPSTRRSKYYIPIATSSLLIVTATSVIASFIADAVPSWMQQNMRFVGGITVLLYALVSGSAAASLPCYERRSPPNFPHIGVP